MESHYEVLGVSPDADREEVRRAYRSLLKDHHPDQGGSRERFLRIRDAYERITGESAPPRGKAISGAILEESVDPTFDLDVREQRLDRGLTVSGNSLTLSLVGLVQGMELSTLITAPSLSTDTRRSVAFFEIENTGSDTLEWHGYDRTSFIGDDGFMYEGSSIVQPHADDLPGRWYAGEVAIEPGRALDAVVVAQEVPGDVTIEEVLYTQHVYDEGEDITETERYLFDLKPRVRGSLDRPPFEH